MQDLHARVDVLLIGGGVAGLWLLGRLAATGYSVLLLERRALGGVQTLASQGIIHSGVKYALGGRLTEASRAIAGMPQVWRDCLAGRGELDLNGVRVLSPHQYLWSSGGLSSRLAGFLAGMALRSRVQALRGDDRPEPFRHRAFAGALYRLDEPVLDVPSLVAALIQGAGERTRLAYVDEGLELGARPQPYSLLPLASGRLRVSAQLLVLAAGEGNEELLGKLGRDRPQMQRRPLHMLMLKGRLPALYGHCLDGGATPRLTVTAHPLEDGRMVWYLGGRIAEAGVGRSSESQIAAGREELRDLLPWIDQPDVEWATLRVVRAESAQAGGLRPDACFLHAEDRVLVAWPTKLALAPRLAADVLAHLRRSGIVPGVADLAALDHLAAPPLGLPPWKEPIQWS